MRSFDGTVWDPVIRRWVWPTPEVIERRVLYLAAKLPPTKAIEIPNANKPNEIPGDRARIPSYLLDAAEQLVQNRVTTSEQKEEDYRAYASAIGRTIRAGRTDIPIVKNWIAGQRSVNNYDELRRVKRGLESDRLDEMDKADFWITIRVVALIEAARSGAGRAGQVRGGYVGARRPRRDVSFGQIYHELWKLLNACDFPGPLLLKNNQNWLVESARERTALKETLRLRLRTKQNLHKRLLLLDVWVADPNPARRKVKRGRARLRRATP